MDGDNAFAREEEKDARKSQGSLHIQLSQRSSIRIGGEIDKMEKGQMEEDKVQKLVEDSVRHNWEMKRRQMRMNEKVR